MQQLEQVNIHHIHVNKDFYKLWVGQSLSVIGSQIAVVTLPLWVLNVLGSAINDNI